MRKEIMDFGVVYIVTKKSRDGSFHVGDHILLDRRGFVHCWEAGGSLTMDEYLIASVGMEIAEAERQVSTATQ
jgi:hypothetical protein